MTTKRQDALIKSVKKTAKFNEFNPVRVAGLLHTSANLWTRGRWDEKTATLYLYPRKDKKELLVSFAKSLKADEINYMDLLDYRAPKTDNFANPVGAYPVLATGGLRIWWD